MCIVTPITMSFLYRAQQGYDELNQTKRRDSQAQYQCSFHVWIGFGHTGIINNATKMAVTIATTPNNNRRFEVALLLAVSITIYLC